MEKGIITPIPKKGNNTEVNNIQPITLTQICGKLLEKIVTARLITVNIMKFIVTNRWGSVRTGLQRVPLRNSLRTLTLQ